MMYRAKKPPIAFVGDDSLVHIALPAGAGWTIETVHPVPGGRGCAIVLDDDHQPLVAFHDAAGMLFWARRLATGWSPLPIDPTSVVRGSVSLAQTPAGLVIAYLDAATGVLRFAEQNAGGSWTIENVAQIPIPAFEAHPSLAVDGNARAISYYDAAHHDLRIALRQIGGGWSNHVIDAIGDPGRYSSLVGAPSQGIVGVAYYDSVLGQLRFAHGSPTTGWTIDIVDDDGDVGRFCSAFAFTGSAAGRIGITYFDRDRADLKYAQSESGGPWSVVVLDSVGDVGRKASCGGTPLPTDSLGVAYAEDGTGTLRYLLRTSNTTAVPDPFASTNPFRVRWSRSRDGGGTIRFDVRDAGAVRVSVHDAQGRLLAVPFAHELPAGAAQIPWDGHDQRGHAVPSGVYLIRVETVAVSAATAAAVLR
jgi:hypothetical protein